tara:strand:+ start:497 stop:1957 length:1461 start_codon:yes stop_codon:yes gene_type:complete
MKKSLLCALLFSLSIVGNVNAATPNVLLIISDDLNRHLAAVGYQQVPTPALSRLAQVGMRFNRAYCQYPVCGPSRASFLSGVYPEATGVLDNKTDVRESRPEIKSLPQLFKDSGYWTGGVGKVFHGKLDPGDVAWDEYQMFQNEWNPVVKPVQEAFEAEFGSINLPNNQKAWRTKLKELRGAAGGQTPPGYGPTQMSAAQHKDGKNVRQVSSWLRNNKYGEKPFFIACGIHKPHVPFWAPQKYFDMHPAHSVQVDPSVAGDWDDIPAKALVHRYEAFGFQRETENMELRRKYMQAYHACISFVDAQIAEIWKALDEKKLWDDTVVIFLSDHGYHLGEHFLWGKVTLFEECARVPLLMYVPKLTTAGSESQSLVELVDLVPTLCQLCTIAKPKYVQGVSLVPVLGNPQALVKKQAYTVVMRGPSILGRSVRTDRWRFADWGNEEFELYDLKNDPAETKNRVKMSSDIQLERMQRLLKQATSRALENN